MVDLDLTGYEIVDCAPAVAVTIMSAKPITIADAYRVCRSLCGQISNLGGLYERSC